MPDSIETLLNKLPYYQFNYVFHLQATILEMGPVTDLNMATDMANNINTNTTKAV